MSMNNSQSSLLNLASLVQEESNNSGSGNVENGTRSSVSNTGSNFSNTPRAMQDLSLPQLNYNSSGGTSNTGTNLKNNNGNANNRNINSSHHHNNNNINNNNNDGNNTDALNDSDRNSATEGSISSGNDASSNDNRDLSVGSGSTANQKENMNGKTNNENGNTLDQEDNGELNDEDVEDRIRDTANSTGRSTPGFMQYPKSTMSTASLQRMNIPVPGIDMPLVTGDNSPQLSPMNMNNLNNMNLGNHHSLGKIGASPLVNSTLGNSTTPSVTTTPVGAELGGTGRINTNGSGNGTLMGMQMPMMLNSGSDSNTNPNANAKLTNNSNGGGGVMYNGGIPGLNNMPNTASQRMMNMKSDLTDLPMNPPNSNNTTTSTNTINGTTGINSSTTNATGNQSSQTSGSNPASLLQNSTTLATSTLPTITMINDGERLNTEGELIGKSRKALRNTKRAAQNRNAQRAFRQRREKYIKDLEFKARDYNRIAAELETYKAENRMLKFQLGQYQQKINL